MNKNSDGRIFEKHSFADHFAGRNEGGWIHFHGMVTDNQSSGVENAIVMLFACYTNGTEKPLAHTFTGKNGGYFITIPKHPDNPDLLKYKVRAGKPHTPGKALDEPVTVPKETYTDTMQDPGTVQLHAEDIIPVQNSIINQVIFNVRGQNINSTRINDFWPEKKFVTGPIKSGKASISEYYRKIYQQLNRHYPEKIFFVPPDRAPDLDEMVLNNIPVESNKEPQKRAERTPAKNELNSATFMCSYLACLLFCLQKKK